MSSDEGDQAGPSASKRPRRMNNACDECRKRKIRCDGKQLSSGKCTHCNAHMRECAFTTKIEKYPAGYVAALETKVKKLEGLIGKMLPGQDFTEVIGFELTRDNWMLPGVCGGLQPHDLSSFLAVPAPALGGTLDPTVSTSALSTMGSSGSALMMLESDDQYLDTDDASEVTIKLHTLRSGEPHKSTLLSSYLGRSSVTEIVRKAYEMRAELAPDIKTGPKLRPRLWKRPAWLAGFENNYTQRPLYFPEQNLLDTLVEHYFANVNILTPVLHRPTFEEGLRSYLHLRERNFGSLVLLVCALGSRFTDDRSVLVDGDQTWHSAGWNWFIQARIFDEATLLSPTSHLHMLQAACLATLYASDVSSCHAWMLVGSGIRLALDIGAHKRRAYGTTPALEDELYKRAFWALVHFDRALSASLGRPRCIQEEDFDLEMPLCWEDDHPTHNFELVAQQPSLLSYFVWMLKLSQIEGLALRTVYASMKARVHYKFQGEDWMAQTVAHLDSLLNSWADSLPEYLRWGPSRTDDTYFTQSAYLHLQYRSIQLLIHRPAIAARGLKPLPALSLAVCTSAARSIARVADALNQRKPHQLGHGAGVLDALMWTLSVSAIVLLIDIANARLSNSMFDHKRAMADVELLISVLREREKCWPSAARQVDVLESLKSLGEAGETGQVVRRKRPYDADPQQDLHEQLDTTSDSLFAPPSSDLNVPSSSGQFPSQRSETEGMSYALNEPLSQSTSSVLGNVDFGALFGLGDASLEAERPWSPGPYGGTTGAWAGPFPGSGEGLNFSMRQCAGMAFDLGLDGWPWTAPSQQGMQNQDYTEGPREA